MAPHISFHVVFVRVIFMALLAKLTNAAPTHKPNSHTYKPRTRKPSNSRLIRSPDTAPVPTGTPTSAPSVAQGVVTNTGPTSQPYFSPPKTWTPTNTHFPTVSRYPTRYRTRIPSTTASPSRPTLYPTAGSGQSGGGASNGIPTNRDMNVVQ